MTPVSRAVRRGVAAGAVSILLALSVPSALARAARVAADAARHLPDDRLEARRRVFGAAHANAVEQAARAIPRDGACFLLDASGEEGPATFLAYDLSPRRALYLGRLVDGRRRLVSDGRPGDGPAWVVVATRTGEAPRLVSTASFFARVPALPPGEGDADLPGSIDDPAEGSTVHGPLTVRGWGHEPGGDPLRVVVLVDGEERPPLDSERQARPDVAAAFPAIRDASRSGYAFTFGPAPGDGGAHEVRVHLFSASGRHRRLPPRGFRWEP